MKHQREIISNNVADILETLIVKGTSVFPGVKPNAVEIVERVNTLTYYQLRLQEPVDFFDSRLDVKILDTRKNLERSQLWPSRCSTGMFGRRPLICPCWWPAR
jgi:hypothetical protein